MFEVRGRAIISGYFFLKSAELSVSVLEICAELWVPFKETCRLMGIFFEKNFTKKLPDVIMYMTVKRLLEN